MPKFDPKTVQLDLEKKIIWPVYWLYGPENLKAKELIRRITVTLSQLNFSQPESSEAVQWQIEKIDASIATESEIVDNARTMSLLGDRKLLMISNAHELSDSEVLEILFDPPVQVKGAGAAGGAIDLPVVCIFQAKDLDARKKLSKLVLEKTAAIECAEVPEADRLSWVKYLANRLAIKELPDWVAEKLAVCDPFSLEIVESELQKFSLFQALDQKLSETELDELISGKPSSEADEFAHAFLSRSTGNLGRSIELAKAVAKGVDSGIALVGLLAWNIRHLLILKVQSERRLSNSLKLAPFIQQKLSQYLKVWTVDDLCRFQLALSNVDFSLKQTRLDPLGLWSNLCIEFSKK